MPQLRLCSYCERLAVSSIIRRVGPPRIDPYSAREAERDPSHCEVVRACAAHRDRITTINS